MSYKLTKIEFRYLLRGHNFSPCDRIIAKGITETRRISALYAKSKEIKLKSEIST